MERPRLLILYGSQTGCAADIAERVRREAKRRQFLPALYAMDEYDRVGSGRKKRVFIPTNQLLFTGTTGERTVGFVHMFYNRTR
jgi:sulfite reductase alpha subunit-like flavoprotein